MRRIDENNNRFTKSFRSNDSGGGATQASGGTSKKIDYMRQGIFRERFAPNNPKQSKMSLKRPQEDIPEDSNDDDPDLVKTHQLNQELRHLEDFATIQDVSCKIHDGKVREQTFNSSFGRKATLGSQNAQTTGFWKNYQPKVLSKTGELLLKNGDKIEKQGMVMMMHLK